MSARQRARDESGAFIIIVALLMVGMLIMVGLVIDFGQVRQNRQQNKSVADFAVVAGLHGLEGPGATIRPFQGVCRAYQYLVANNTSELSGITGVLKTGSNVPIPAAAPAPPGSHVSNPCSAPPAFMNAECAPNTPVTWAWFDGTADGGRVKIDIKSGYDLDDGGFSDESLVVGDEGDPELGNCDHLAVIIGEREATTFGAASGTSEIGTTIRSVGRIEVRNPSTETAALVVLDEHACQSLVTSGNNASLRVLATPVGAPVLPGIIQVNSDGRAPNGSSACNGSQRVVEGSALNGGLGPSIVAEPAGTTPGKIGIRAALTNPSFAHTTPVCDTVPTPAGLCTISPSPIHRGLVTRLYVDERYRSPLVTLRTTAKARLAHTAATAAAADYYVADGGAACSALLNRTDLSAATLGRSKVFFNCDLSVGSGNFLELQSDISEVVVAGSVSVSGRLTIKNPREIYIRGATGTQHSASGFTGSGRLEINTAGRPTCTDRFDYDVPTDSTAAGGGRDEIATVVVGLPDNDSGGTFDWGSTAVVRMCNTFLHLASGTIPAAAGASPYENSYNGKIQTGAQGAVDWTSPNQTSARIEPGDVLFNKFEDLALWTETEGAQGFSSRIQGQGTLTLKGIFFTPNANPFALGGSSAGTIEADAQFWTRRLELSGPTKLLMAPDPEDAVPTPAFEGFGLIR